jgi:hypothetical protein
MLKRKQRTCQEGSNGIRDRDVKEQLCLRKERTTGNGIRGWSRRRRLQLVSTGNVNETFRETLELEITKRIAGNFHLTMENKLRDIVQGSAPSEMKEETTYSAVRAGNVGALTTLGTVAAPAKGR